MVTNSLLAFEGTFAGPTRLAVCVLSRNRSAGILAQRRISASAWFCGQNLQLTVFLIHASAASRHGPGFQGRRFLEFRGRAIHVFCLNVSERDSD